MPEYLPHEIDIETPPPHLPTKTHPQDTLQITQEIVDEITQDIAGSLFGNGLIRRGPKGTPGPRQMLGPYSIFCGAKNDEAGAALHSAMVEDLENPRGPAHGFPDLFGYPRDRLARDQVAAIFTNIVRGESVSVTFWNRPLKWLTTNCVCSR